MSDTADQARRWTKRMGPDGEGQVRGGWTAQDVQDGAQMVLDLLAECEAQAKRIGELERPVREPVRWFSERMEERLAANDHKQPWPTMTSEDLLGLWLRAVADLRLAAIPAVTLQNAGRVIQEASDLANFCMMLADKGRAALAAADKQEEP